MASIDELWLVDFGEPHPGEPALHRPALVVGPPEHFGASLPFVLVCPLTTVRRGLSLHIEVDPDAASGLDHVSYVQCEQIRSVSTRRLTHRLGVVPPDVSRSVAWVLRALLDH